MGYLKALIISAVVALAIISMVQNIEPLSQPLAIRLDLIFVKFESSLYAIYLLILLAFFVGLLAASLLGLAERFRMRAEIRARRKEIEALNRELSSLRNLPLTGKPLAGAGKGESPGAKEKPL
jgi:putative membrane protein